MLNNFMTLIVDDEHLNRFLMKKFLASNEIPHVEATDGQEALEWIQQSKDENIIVLLDLNMPVMDGYEFLDYMSNNYFEFKDRKILIIVVSASDYTVFRQNAPNADIVQYLTKPISKEILIEAVLKAGESLNATV
jgi:CheY-like chemotaxis protein